MTLPGKNNPQSHEKAVIQHSSVKITRIYLGLRKEELLETYDLLEM